MAPSKTRSTRGQAQPALKTRAFRVTKSTKLNIQPEAKKQKLQAVEEVVSPTVQPQPQPQSEQTKKRRHDAVSSDCENEAVTSRPQKALKKPRFTLSPSEALNVPRTRPAKVQLPTPPQSSPENESLPSALQELRTLHKSFTQALAVHYAHNGTRNAVSLADLIPAMTRLWKRRTICLQDIQRMLAIWEVQPESERQEQDVEYQTGPFRLLTVGIGSGSHLKLEYAWQELGTFVESELQQRFENVLETLRDSAKRNQHSFVLKGLTGFPLLRCRVGVQTQARKEKINTIKDSILIKPTQSTPMSSQSLDLSRLDISDPSESEPSPRETALRSRTLSLFDRLQAKKLANSISASPTSAELLRQRALHRMPDIIDVLRLKQARKLSSQFRADIHESPSRTFATMMKVSFGLDALVQEIRDSGKTNIANDEIRECISILGGEVPDAWCSVYTSGHAKCVTLQGEGWRKEDVRQWCERELSRIGGSRR